MIFPKQAAVRPRVILPDDGELLLEDAVRARLDAGAWGIIELLGASGAGKATSLAHLMHAFSADGRLTVADSPDATESKQLLKAASTSLVVYASPSSPSTELRAIAERWGLARWTDDDCIEYLLRVHPNRCASVMHRIKADPQRKRLAGLAELWRIVLDQLAVNESAADVRAALWHAACAWFPEAAERSAVGRSCFELWCNPVRADCVADLLSLRQEVDKYACPLLRHSLIQNLLAADYLAEQLREARNSKVLAQRIPKELLQAAAALVRGDTAVIGRLERIAASRKRACHPMAASLLHAMQASWRPANGRAPFLTGAYLAGVLWPGIRLKRLDITAADMTDCDLSEARLKNVSAQFAQLCGARLHGAQLLHVFATKANLAGADLSHVRAPQANLEQAGLADTNLEGALLRGANFAAADLSRCNFRRADLTEAQLIGAKLAGADFTGANLSGASLHGLTLSDASFAGAQFAHVSADLCELEYMRLPGANFDHASLRGALLTGSQMLAACFRSANLAEAGLAEIEWERADLRDANLRGCTFHLGSSRSGLVNSPIACEGSRTGFYTDEYYEQGFMAPEEIRKANLCGADLRGAVIDNVDFYLVDLRGAQYTPEQEEHFRRCRAILKTRV